MKKIIMLILIVVSVISCEELARLRREYHEEVRERGRECFYDHKGDFIGCKYIN